MHSLSRTNRLPSLQQHPHLLPQHIKAQSTVQNRPHLQKYHKKQETLQGQLIILQVAPQNKHSSLPRTLQISHQSRGSISLTLGNGKITGKNAGKTMSLPWRCEKEEWLQIGLGSLQWTVRVKSNGVENQGPQTQIFTSVTAWKKSHPKNFPPHTINLEQMISQLALSPSQKHRHKPSDKQIAAEGQFCNKRTDPASKRRLRSITSRHQEGSQLSNRNNTDRVIKGKKQWPEEDLASRKSTASHENSRLRSGLSGKIIEKSSFFEDICGYRPVPHKLTDLYKDAPITIQELRTKRQRFESQFISRQFGEESALKTEESEVAEEIVRREEESRFEDSLERVQAPVVDFNLEESGTLCQSVFQ